MIQILPGILEKTFEEIEKKVKQVEELVDWVHIDVLDNTLIHNVTYNHWPAFRAFDGRVNLEAHLMVADPAKYVDPMATNGFKRLIAHAEANDVREFITKGREYGIEIGVVLDGPSGLEMIEPYMDDIDTALVMMYKAGASGQAFQHEHLKKVRKIHEEFKILPIEVDGGIAKDTAPLVREAGATRLVSTSYLFWKNAERIAEAIEELKG